MPLVILQHLTSQNCHTTPIKSIFPHELIHRKKRQYVYQIKNRKKRANTIRSLKKYPTLVNFLLYIKALRESLPVDQTNTASITQSEKNAQVWVLVVGLFKQLLKNNFKYLDGPDQEDKNRTTAQSKVKYPPSTKKVIFIQTNLSYKLKIGKLKHTCFFPVSGDIADATVARAIHFWYCCRWRRDVGRADGIRVEY